MNVARLRGRVVLALAALAGLAAGYLGWARDLAVFRVEKVVVTGVTGPAAPELRAALIAATRGMTTLHVREDRLEQAAASFPAVRAISAEAKPPNGLRIAVDEHRAVAVLVSRGDRSVPVTSEGLLLRNVKVGRRLPAVPVVGALPGERVVAGPAQKLVKVASTAPRPLGNRIARLRVSPQRGIVAVLRHGPAVYFGSTSLLQQKWAAAARVLAHPTSVGADYVDVRLPERAVAGPFEDARPEVETSSETNPLLQG